MQTLGQDLNSKTGRGTWKKLFSKLCMMTHACNLSTVEAVQNDFGEFGANLIY